MSTDLPLDQLDAALARTAAGRYAHEAALRLLLEHGEWIARLAQAGLIDLDDDDPGDPQTQRLAPAGERYAWIRWTHAVDAIESGQLYASGSSSRILRIAASLASDSTLNLEDAVSGLDRTNLTLVLAALSHANGAHEHREYLLPAADDGQPPVITPSTPRVDLGPVHPWPNTPDT